jgi:NAD(P)-dependent dehydrogenase (short-subunit alcohol dehydrogenase family)
MNEERNMAGKTCLITGSSSGHGQAVAEALARRGAEVILHGLRRGDCDALRDRIESLTGKRPEAIGCDFSSRNEIEKGAAEILAWKRPLHVLVNNAGLVCRYRSLSKDGIEETFAVNYLAMFQFTLLLLPRLIASAPARIVNVGSDAHMIASIDPGDIDGSGRRYSMSMAYGRSKLAVAYFTVELSRRLHGTGVTVNAVDPGPMATNIANKPGLVPRIAHAVIGLTFPHPSRAARTAIHLAASPDIEGKSGGYFRFMKMKEPRLRGGRSLGNILWEKSARLTGVDYP